MQTAENAVHTTSMGHTSVAHDRAATDAPTMLSHYQIIRRNGAVVPFEPAKIAVAMMKAFLAVHGTQGAASASVREMVEALTQAVVRALMRSRPGGGTFHIEDVQDQVELGLMRGGHHEIARAYVLYRESRNQERAHIKEEQAPAAPTLHVIDNGQRVALDLNNLKRLINDSCAGLGADVKPDPILAETMRNLYDGVPMDEVYKAAILATRTLIEKDPDYTYATARLLMHTIAKEVLGKEVLHADMGQHYAEYFPQFIQKGVDNDLLDPAMLQFDLPRLGAALKASRDLQFDYLGLQTLYDRYFLHVRKNRIELPQAFFMRVAMGLSLNEVDREARAIEFYEVLSSFDFMSSTPTLFNSGTLRSQLSSCYLSTVPDHLDGIYELIKENALLSKFAGGLGNDWTRVRALGSHIKGTNGESQGVVPFLKVVNDTAVAVNQGGKRKGAVCTYLETWHLDIEEFLELRKNTGDDRRRTHDMNTANWIPDLFMRRVMEKGEWTLFSPSDVPDLHDLFGAEFEKAYVAYEAKAKRGEIKPSKTMQASDMWRKMLTMLFETGHPWITFKDPCNVRSPQQHVGVVHSSNLCTEITLNTSDTETAVCNLGSVNLSQHLKDGPNGKELDHDKLKRTIKVAMRMLDNVIDINYYAVKKARDSNLRHRPVGMGIMAFQDSLYEMRVPYASQAAVEFADRSMEAVCYYAYWASSELAKERGQYASYKGSLWDKGILPIDSLDMLAQARGGYLEVDRSKTMDWDALRAKIAKDGMRNSNCVAIAPTATISNIIGVDASIEPCFGNLSVKSNLSGEFTIINHYLVHDLKRLGLWDDVMVMDLKHFDGSLRPIDRVPQEVKALYATAFEVEPTWLVEAASRRQKWIDQAQSLNIYMAGASGKKLDETYKLAWLRGLKTTYYLRTSSAQQVEKSTVQAGSHNAVSSGPAAGGMNALEAAAAAAQAQMNAIPATDIKFCGVDDPTCESCQ
ncbi:MULTISPECIES: ribonucleoside-diphosphate reductase subunit alpha [unclassified Limnohabitans]|uniref:ribonucleoside-diphosphate reductase subunit alpha n=1 Tax=unclassified Limnohabitans TaxID=2626134 RepID=UPI000CF28C09|nr:MULTISPECIES: ribonucleoside-diphosphate reductase subunit alpha [unclassified Limnohabitans]PQA84685.1 ribonucleoside-diphosphate reductase subunit alpha [Limnohabitans sp. TS-CS-82]BDU54721.1 ribonucleoside-diphosphate reductase [Limnohabitans sp. TEGF004]